MTKDAHKAAARLRLVLAPGIAIGPGKADLLEGISETGSIAAAGRRMGMSYKRAWQLADALNGYFSEPLIEAVKGGKAGGGARLTKLGENVLMRYRRMEAATAKAVARDLAALRRAASKS
jgi:molybdate transport system regulatory protein